MALQTAAEIEAMIQDLGGVPVVVGAVQTWGLRMDVDQVALDDGAEVMVEVDQVTVATGILPELSRGMAITVDGEALMIGETRRAEDGAETIIELEALREA